MNPLKVIAVLLIIVGAIGTFYGGFSYTRETHHADVGPLHLELRDKRHVNIPLWAGIGALVAGAALLVTARKG